MIHGRELRRNHHRRRPQRTGHRLLPGPRRPQGPRPGAAPPRRRRLRHRRGLSRLQGRSEEHTSELQSHLNLVCRLLLAKKKIKSAPITLERKLTILELEFVNRDAENVLQDLPALNQPRKDTPLSVDM